MRWVTVIVSLAILGFGVLLVLLALLLSNRADNTGLIPIGVFFVLVGLGLTVWTIRRARRWSNQASWRFLDH